MNINDSRLYPLKFGVQPREICAACGFHIEAGEARYGPDVTHGATHVGKSACEAAYYREAEDPHPWSET